MSDRRGKPEGKKAPPAFGNDALKNALAKWKTEEKKPAPPPPRVVVRPQPPATPKTRRNPGDEEDAFFRAAMEDVVPVKRTRADHEPPRVERTPQEIDEDAEAFAQLTELVATGEGIDIADTDEHIEGIAVGADRGLLSRLRRGDFSFRAHLDLHGLLADDARAELEKFLVECRRSGHRCVLVIHGRGLHSKDQQPVLKSRVGTWLSRGRLSRIVLAFSTARPADGGAGALYVLLRK